MSPFKQVSILIQLSLSNRIIEKSENVQQLLQWHDWYQKNAIPVINGLELEIQTQKQTRSGLLQSPKNDANRMELEVLNRMLERRENFSGFLQIHKTQADYAVLFSHGHFIDAHNLIEKSLGERKYQPIFRSDNKLDKALTAQHYLYMGEALLANIAHGGKQLSADDTEIAKAWFYRAEKILSADNPHVAFAQGWNEWQKGNIDAAHKAVAHIVSKGNDEVLRESGKKTNLWFYKQVPAEYKQIIERAQQKRSLSAKI